MATHSPAELALVQQLFTLADPNKLGIITGDAALQVFGKTNLPATTLGEIWAIADKDNNGFLTKKDTAVALRLIGHAQRGGQVSEDLANKPGPLAHLDGISIPNSPRSPPPRPPTANSLPPFTPDDKTKFLRMFVGAGPTNGLLSGDKARDIFLKSKLPFDKLSQIWQLADTKNRGALDSADFAIAMYFVRSAMSNPTLTLPTTLPLGLYEQAGGQIPVVASHNTGGSIGLPPTPFGSTFNIPPQSAVKPQFTGGALNAVRPQLTGQPLKPQLTGQRSASVTLPSGSGPFPNALKPATSPDQFWDVSPQEKNTFDGFFRTLDPQNKGFIEGDVAVPFLLKSGLGEDILAQVWDLADMHNDGKLTQDTFAVAMHLINGKLAGKPLPDHLPESLIPPSQRQQSIKPPAPVSQIQRDLFELEASPPGSPIVPEQPTGFLPQRAVSAATAFSPLPTLLPTSTSPPRLQQQPQRLPQVQVQFKDLLGDDDDGANENAQIHTNAAEIGNIQNKVNSTQQSLKSTQQERKTLEETIAAQASQLSSLQSQLSTASAAYETEKRLLETLQERMATQNTEIQKTREELIRRESELSALKLEKSEVEGTLLRDKEDVRQLQQQMKETNESTELVKAEIEKVKKEARQQKGRLAIAKKQLATSETEKEKTAQELQAAQLELEQTEKDLEATEAQIADLNDEIEKMKVAHVAARTTSPPPAEVAARVHLPDTPDITTPMLTSSPKSTNPFEKLAMASSSPKPESPFQPFAASLPPQNHFADIPTTGKSLLDDPFGLDSEPMEEARPEIADKTADLITEIKKISSESPAETKVSKENGDAEASSAAEKFPALEEVRPKSPEEGEPQAAKEVEQADESDSSDDEDGTPLASIRASHVSETQPKLPPGLPNGPDVAIGSVQEPTSPSAFDDIFAPEQHPEVETKKESDTPADSKLTDAFESTFADNMANTPETKPDHQTAQPLVSGVDAFDEAMGKITPKAQTDSNAPFSFETNFGDTFDFGASREPVAESANTSFPQPLVPSAGTQSIPNASLQSGSLPSLPPIDHQSFSFDDAFGESAPKETEKTNGVAKSLNGEVSFDDVFNTTSSQPATSTSDAKPQQANNIPPRLTSSPRPSSPQPRPVPSPPTSPNRTLSSHRSISPTPGRASRPLSPPPRRSSTSISKPQQEDKRSHKLSIRFPFGRKGKDKERNKKGIPLPDNGHLTPVGEPSQVNEDDTEPLKALCSMGFSRTQALAALEEHNFDMSKALNSLLGSQ